MRWRKPTPTETQAKLIARLWASGDGAKIGGYVNATEAACLKRGWLVATDEVGKFPSGQEYRIHRPSDDALSALEQFLSNSRNRRELRGLSSGLCIPKSVPGETK